MDKGYFSINRSLLASDLWLNEPFTRGQAWIDLIGLANHKPGQILKRGIVTKLKRGHVGYSQRVLSERWKWSRTKLKNFLNYLENEQQIEQQKNNVTTLIYIVKYDEYQTKRATKRATEEPQKSHRPYQNNNDNNDNKELLCREDDQKQVKTNNKPARDTAKKIILFLNEKAGKNFRPVDANINFILARLKEGFTEDEIRQVTAMKIREWSTDEKMHQYMRPATLYNKTNFAQYSGELRRTESDAQQ